MEQLLHLYTVAESSRGPAPCYSMLPHEWLLTKRRLCRISRVPGSTKFNLPQSPGLWHRSPSSVGKPGLDRPTRPPALREPEKVVPPVQAVRGNTFELDIVIRNQGSWLSRWALGTTSRPGSPSLPRPRCRRDGSPRKNNNPSRLNRRYRRNHRH